MCLRNPGTDDEQVAVRHADASGGYILENQHEEEIMRDIQVRRTSDLSTRLRMHQYLPIHMFKCAEVKSFEHISALDAFDEKDWRKSRYIGESVGLVLRRRCWRS